MKDHHSGNPTRSNVMVTEITRIELAQQLFREFYSSCFWHHRPDLLITEDKVPLVVEGMRRHGGKRGLQAAARLMLFGEPSSSCR